MVTQAPGKWAVRGATFALWSLAAACAAYWGLKLASQPPGLVAPVAVRVAPPVDPAAVARLLGSSPAATAAAPVVNLYSRFTLVGVVAGASQSGAALIAVDGKPAKPFRVGAAIDEGLVLQSVQGRRAVLAASADGPPVVTLELPPLRKN